MASLEADIVKACERKDFGHVVALMTAHLADPEVQLRGCFMLSVNFAKTEADCAAQAAAGAIEAAVAALQAHPADATVQGCGCLLLCKLGDTEERTTRALAAGAVEAVVAALRGQPESTNLQDYGCRALVAFGMRDDVQTAAARAGALPLLVATLRTLFRHRRTQVHLSACRALLYLVCMHEENADKACRPEVFAALCAALRVSSNEHEDEDEDENKAASMLRVEACTVLSHLLRSNSAAGQLAAAVMAGSEVVSAVLAAMRADPGERSLQRQGASVLRFLLADAANMAAARAAGADAVLRAALHEHSDDTEIETLCGKLLALLQPGAAAPPLELVGACPDVAHAVELMRRHPADALLQSACCYWLEQSVYSDCDYVAVASARGVDVLLATLRAHAASSALQTRACRALTACISGNATCAVPAVALGAVELAVAAMRAHLTDADVQLAACSMLGAMRKVAD
jgi:hypothetical protein